MIQFQLALRAQLLAVACILAAECVADTTGENAHAQSDSLTSYDQVSEKLSAFIERELQEKQIPALSIALVADGQVVWAEGFGEQVKEDKHKADPSTVYRVGSVSKLFTDLALMQLVAEGKLDLDADIREYLPDFAPHNPFARPITLRLLMSHRSGLVREPPVGHYFDPTEPSLQATVESLNDTTLVYEPGTRTKYSNAAIAVVGYVVEKTAGRPFEEHIEETLLKPLGMQSSSFRRSDKVAGNIADAWMWNHHAPRVEAPTFALGTSPAGNLYSSVNNLSNFLIAVLAGGEFEGKAMLPPNAMDEMLARHLPLGASRPDYGLGFRLSEIDGHPTFGHGGAVYGFSTQLTGLPEDGVGVVAAASLDVSNGLVERITNYAVRLMLAAKEGRELPGIESSEAIADDKMRALDGAFASGADVLELTVRDGKLFLKSGYMIRELRESGGDLVADDVSGFGPRIKVVDDNRLLMNGRSFTRLEDTLPPEAPKRWEGLIGEYGWDHNTLYVYEDRGQLWALIEWVFYYPLTELGPDRFAFPDAGLYHGEQLLFERDAEGVATKVVAAEVEFDRRPVGLASGEVFQIEPTAPMDELRTAALAAQPPEESGDRREPELVELTKLDPSILLDIRYAGVNNFMGSVFYKQARAFMQQPAAEAVVKVHENLAERGYGLLVHDAYRPWYVTKMFWDGTPEELRDFVANPANGSRHNRGCAVDLTLYDLQTNEPIQMVAGYDEFSPRSYPYYPGGTSRERWHRKLLRQAMEREGFSIYEFEWWHFDYKDWNKYPITNLRFEEFSE